MHGSMKNNQQGQDDISPSAMAFPSLNLMHSAEEAIDGNTSADDAKGTKNSNVCGSESEEAAEPTSQHLHDECDGYPTDEHTVRSFARTKETELKRQTILKLARNRLARKNPGDIPKDICDSKATDAHVDDSSFLGNVDAVDVENGRDDSSFLVKAGVEVEDAVDDLMSIGDRCEDGTVDTYYDVYASTLSRASESTKASTIGDRVLKDSIMAAQMAARNGNNVNTTGGGENQSASTYSYRRAYVDNVTLGSNFTSTCSALTDDYCFDARRTGMSEAIRVRNIREGQPYHEDAIMKSPSRPVDTDSGAVLQPSDNSQEESLARPPPPCLPNQQANSMVYENDPEHLTRIVSFGEGEGYVDEAAARRYAEMESKHVGGCCGWFRSSSRFVKLVVMCAMFLMLVSVASVALALLLPEEEHLSTTSSASSGSTAVVNVSDGETREGSAFDDHDNSRPASVPTISPTPIPTSMPTSSINTYFTDAPTMPALPTITPTRSLSSSTCDAGSQCLVEGSRCTDGSTETCCGETFDSFVCDCAYLDGKFGKLQYMCYFTDACLIPSCETLKSSSSPSASPSASSSAPSVKVATLPPSKAPESIIYTASSITSSPAPLDKPLTVPKLQPTIRPTEMPTQKPSKQPTKQPTREPTKDPTKQPTDHPTTTSPSKEPTQKPNTPLPTTVMPTEFPIITPSRDPTTMPIPISSQISQTVTLKATKDAFIDSSAPYYNYGTFRRLRVDGSPRVWSIIGFDTPSVINSIAQTQRQYLPASENEPRKMQAVRVIQAKLRLYCLDEGGGAIFFALPNARQSWSEKSLVWNNLAGQVDRSGEFRVASLDSLDWFDSDQWIEIDVTEAFTSNLGSNFAQSFLIKSVSSNGVAFASRERGPGPELVLTITSGTSGGATTPILASPTPSPESLWPTYSPIVAEAADPLTPRPSMRPTTSFPTSVPTSRPSLKPTVTPTVKSTHPTTMVPTSMPSRRPTDQPVSADPTKSPSPKPTRRPSTRAPHKRPREPTLGPTKSKFPTDTTLFKTNPATVVPPGCAATDDINLAVKEALMQQNDHNIHVVFPSQDGYVRGGVYSDENYGSSSGLVLDPTSKALIEFDIGLLAVTSNLYTIRKITLRLFVDEVVDNGSDILSLSFFTHSLEWDEERVTWNSFGSPPVAEVGSTFEVKTSDEGDWIDLDITGFVGIGSQIKRFVLAMKSASVLGETGQCVLASRKTCHSSKLIVVTEPL